MLVPPSHEHEQWLASLSNKARRSDKDWTTALLLAIFFGWAGLDRFYLGYALGGLLKMFTFGGLLIWWLLDVMLLLFRKMRDAEGGVLN